MSNKNNASRQQFNGQPYVLDNDVRLHRYQHGATANLLLKVYTATGASAANGGYTFTLPAGYFTTIYNASASVVRDSLDPAYATFAMVRSISTTSVVVHTFESKTTGVLLGGTIEGLESCGGGQNIQLMVFGV